jgi:hypothetical protein
VHQTEAAPHLLPLQATQLAPASASTVTQMARWLTYKCGLLQGDDGDAATSQLTPAIRSAIGHEPAAYRLAVFGILHGSDSQMVGALVRCNRLT